MSEYENGEYKEEDIIEEVDGLQRVKKEIETIIN